MVAANRKLDVAKAFGTAARVATPVAIPAVGAVGGFVLGRWVLAKASPQKYASEGWRNAAGFGGALVGAGVPLLFMVSTRNKGQAEKAQRATLPLGILGAGMGLGALFLGPKLIRWLMTKMPEQAGAPLPGQVVGQLPMLPPFNGTTAPQTAPQTFTRAPPQMLARGLSPVDWQALERAAGLTPQGWRQLESGGSDSRWA